MEARYQVHWLRIGVEGVVIVDSILLAFWIQAWWVLTRSRWCRYYRPHEDRLVYNRRLPTMRNGAELSPIVTELKVSKLMGSGIAWRKCLLSTRISLR